MRPLETTRVHLCRDPVDFRKAINGLSILVTEELELDPFSAHVFGFCNQLQLTFVDGCFRPRERPCRGSEAGLSLLPVRVINLHKLSCVRSSLERDGVVATEELRD